MVVGEVENGCGDGLEWLLGWRRVVVGMVKSGCRDSLE